MNIIPFNPNTYFISKFDNNEVYVNECCSFILEEEDAYSHILIPKYYFDRQKITKDMLKSFVNSLKHSFDKKSSIDEIDLINGNDINNLEIEVVRTIPIKVLNEDINFHVSIQLAKGRTHSPEFHLRGLLKDIFDLKKIESDIDEIKSKNYYRLNIISILSVTFLMEMIQSLPLDLLSNYVLDEKLKSYLTKDKDSYRLRSGIYLDEGGTFNAPENIKKVFKSDVDFYKIPIHFYKDKKDYTVYSFILLNILRTYQTGYNINLIGIYNSLTKKHPEIKGFFKISYFLFSCQAIESLIEYTNRLDYSRDFRIIQFYNDRLPEYTEKKEQFESGDNLYSYLCSKGMIDDCCGGDEDDEDYDYYYDRENPNNWEIDFITITKEKSQIIYDLLKKNYTKRLLKTLKWI